MNSSRRTGRSEREIHAIQRATRVLDRPITAATLRQRLDDLTHAGTDLTASLDLASDSILDTALDLDSPVDIYGNGLITALEHHVADLLGTEDAAYFPTGTMAQQAALRCWAHRSHQSNGRGDERGTVALHGLSHPQLHESDTLTRLAGLTTIPLTTAPRPLTANDIHTVTEPFGTLMLELPLRDAGYLLPTWEELVEVTTTAHNRGATVHLDGARLWETTTHLGHPLHDIVALADSVYVSFYKSLRGLSGAALAGPADFIDHTRLERHRYGGNLFQQFPAALTALHGLQHELPQLPTYVAHARVVAEALTQELADSDLPYSAIHPTVPHTHQFQLWLPHPAELLNEAATRQAEHTGTALFTNPWRQPGLPPGLSYTEITVSHAGLGWTADDVRTALHDYLDILTTITTP